MYGKTQNTKRLLVKINGKGFLPFASAAHIKCRRNNSEHIFSYFPVVLTKCTVDGTDMEKEHTQKWVSKNGFMRWLVRQLWMSSNETYSDILTPLGQPDPALLIGAPF